MAQPIREWIKPSRDTFVREILPAYQPAVLRGLGDHWPLVLAAKESNQALIALLASADQGAQVETFFAPPEVRGRYFYAEDGRGFNFQKNALPFAQCLQLLHKCLSLAESAPGIYMGSTPLSQCLPTLLASHQCPLLDAQIEPRLWMGNQSLVQPHMDESDNIALVAAGRRRFTLFPPEQIDNLYLGPLDVTPAGQAISLVPLQNPDLQQYPRYQQALDAALVAELAPGDGIYIPSLWWHGVEALAEFNLLMNFWWRDADKGRESAEDALIHAILTISHLPDKERMAWRNFFDHYVFRPERHPLAHLPEAARGVLGQMNPQLRQVMRTYLYKRMGLLK